MWSKTPTDELISALKLFTRRWFVQNIPDLKLKFLPVFAELRCQGKAEGGFGLCLSVMQNRTWSIQQGKRRAAAPQLEAFSPLLWFSEKVVLRSSPRQNHTFCPRIRVESKISCTSVPKLLDVAENIIFRWSFGVGAWCEWHVKDLCSFTEAPLLQLRMDGKGVFRMWGAIHTKANNTPLERIPRS